MKVTVELEHDVAAMIRAEAGERGLSFDEVLNSAIRRGRGGARFRQRTFPLGGAREFNRNKALQFAGDV